MISKDLAKKKLISGENILIVDARPRDIYRGGNNQIFGALHMTENLAHEMFLNLPKNKEYLIYGNSGEDETAEHFAEFLKKKGFDASAIEGGYEEWRDSGFPVEPINSRGTPIIFD